MLAVEVEATEAVSVAVDVSVDVINSAGEELVVVVAVNVLVVSAAMASVPLMVVDVTEVETSSIYCAFEIVVVEDSAAA